MKNPRSYLSYFFPVTEYRTSSRFNPFIELRWEGGVLVMNTKNANYSYGALHQVMKFALGQVRTRISATDQILVLGLGGGGVIQLLRDKYQYKGVITVIEIDPEIIRLYQSYFSKGYNNYLTIIEADAYQWLGDNQKTFGLIIDDLFIDKEVPEGASSSEFYDHILNSLDTGGIYVRNMIYHNQNSRKKFELLLGEHFQEVDMKEFDLVNKLYFAVKV